MNLLAVDTSTVACTVALRSGDAILERHEEQPREHTRLLLPMIDALLDEAGLEPAGLDAVVLGNGPGSFIGLRIGAAVAQGICHVTAAALVPVSSLAALAAQAFAEAGVERALVAQDAHRQEVYLAAFEQDAAGLPRTTQPLRLAAAGPLPEPAPDYVALGAGWARYPALWAENRAQLGGRLDLRYPRARYLLGPGLSRWREGGAVAPEQLEPAYVRERVATEPHRRQP